jgi:hypothetical protein
MPSVDHSTKQYENNRAEVSHQPTRQRAVPPILAEPRLSARGRDAGSWRCGTSRAVQWDERRDLAVGATVTRPVTHVPGTR